MKHVYVYLLFFLFCGSSVYAQTRGAYVEKITNEHSSFAVRVDVNHPDRVYAKNDLLQATVSSSEDGYLYLFYRDAKGNVSVLFPNQYHQDNRIWKGETITVPAPEQKFQIRMDAPFGDERLTAVVSKKKLDFLNNMNLTGAPMTQIAEGDGEGIMKFIVAQKTPDWAEHYVNIHTVETRPQVSPGGIASCPTCGQQLPAPSSSGQSGEKRFAVSIGISNYRDDNISKLGICHIDAEQMHDVFLKRCGVEKDNAILVENEQATLANIRKVIKEELPRSTKPGDIIFIFWSGHGGQTEDGKREFLVPYDGSGENIEGTMLMDETFGRWIQELDGRKVLIILDACHSGGLAAQAKDLTKALNNEPQWKPLRFALDNLAVAKNIGQKGAAVIASSTSSEVSFVRKERDLSVLTYHASQVINNARSPLTHVQLKTTIKPLVDEYIRQNFPDKRQTVVMQDDMTEPLVLNP